MNSRVEPRPGGSAIIAQNTLWMGIEAVAALLTALATSVAIARTFGPARLGYFNFVLWLTGLSASLGSLGIPVTTAKYIAEFLGRREPGVVRTVFYETLRAQAILALVIAVIEGTLVLTVFNPSYRLVSLVIVLGILPQMIAYIPSQANNAAEKFRANVPGSVAGMAVYTIGVILTLLFHWDLMGVAASVLLCHLTEMTIKLGFTLPWVLASPALPLPNALRGRMFSFSRQSFTLMLVNLIVWDRSDIFFLKLLNTDIRQIAFFSLPFSLVEKALMAPQVLATSIGATLYAEQGRNPQRMLRLAERSIKYVLLFSVPLLGGLAALSPSVIDLFYGSRYAPAGRVLTVVALFAIAKSTFIPVQALYGATERLRTVVNAALVGGMIDMTLDLILVPKYGAVGAAIANGVGQLYTAVWLWHSASRTWYFRTDFKMLAKVLVSGAIMAAAVTPLSLLLSARVAIPSGIVVGAVVYLLMLRRLALLSHEDESRLFQVWPAATRLRPLMSLISTALGSNGISSTDNSTSTAATARHSS